MSDVGPLSRVSLPHPGVVLAVVAVVGYLLFLGASAAIAPPLERTAEVEGGFANSTYGERATLVGLQGPFRGQRGHAAIVRGNGSVAWKSPEVWAHFDVTPLQDGRVLSAFIRRHAVNCGPYTPRCARTGFRVFDPGSEDPIVREWTYPVRRHLVREVHDVEALPNGNVLVVGMEHERVFAVNGAGEITWQWNASSHYDAPPDPTKTDWLHLNDVDRIGDGRYLVSVRNANQLLVLERGQGVVEVINEDRSDEDDGNCEELHGKVRCGDPSILDHQHNPQWLGENRVLVADSGNDRVVQLRKRNGTWRLNWTLESAGNIPFHWPRDADLLENGNLLVTDSFNHRVVEVAPNGTLVWSVSPGKIPYEADRLPHGEYPPSVLDRSNGTSLGNVSPGSSDGLSIPGFTLLYGAVSAVLPLPYWVNQWHFLGLLLALPVTVGGLVWARRA